MAEAPPTPIPEATLRVRAQALDTYAWLLAEARWHAEWSRDAWVQFANVLDSDAGTKAKVAKPLPWETSDGDLTP